MRGIAKSSEINEDRIEKMEAITNVFMNLNDICSCIIIFSWIIA